MNWTGGSLQRTKQANKGVIQKQKAYFARARTRLQNGPSMPVVPFRPDYIQNGESLEPSGRPSLYGTGSVRHTGHPARPRHEREQRGNLPNHNVLDTDDRRLRSREGATPELSRGGASVMGHVKHPVAKQTSKRKVDDADIETRLLEANKKRLLSKRDWIGLAPARPMHLNFLNDKDKNNIGRRRKVRGSYGAVARQVKLTGDTYNRAGTTGVSKNQPNKICIRIGTDALTTAYSTDHNNYNQSQASSDSMLFDQRTHAVEHIPSWDVAQLVARGGTPPLGYSDDLQERVLRPGENLEALVHCRTNSRSSLTAEAHQESTPPRNRQEQQGYGRSAKPARTQDIPPSEQTASDFQIMQNVQGFEQPLRLLFAHDSPSTERYASNAVHSIGEGGTNHAPREDYAGGAPMGDMHQLDCEPERPKSEAAGAIAIVDEKPWNSLFNIPDDTSSHGGSSCISEKSFVHAYAVPQTREAECTSWSQHATQGDQTHISSSLISASLPSQKRATQTRGPIHDREISKERRNTTLTAMDETERLWRDFVFEDDESHSGAAMSERRDEDDGKGSSAYLPLSVAVSSSTYTPFRQGHILHMGDEAHDAAMSAPPSESQAFPSLAATAGFVEELSDEELDAIDTAERRAFGEHFVTHTSLLNNASGEGRLPLSRSEGSPSRLLDHYPHGRESLQARPSPRRALARKALDSEDDGIDLIDPDRLS